MGVFGWVGARVHSHRGPRRNLSSRVVWLVLSSTLCVGLILSWVSARGMGRLTRMHAEASLPISLSFARESVELWYAEGARELRALSRAVPADLESAASPDLSAVLQSWLDRRDSWMGVALCGPGAALSQPGDRMAQAADTSRVAPLAWALRNVERDGLAARDSSRELCAWTAPDLRPGRAAAPVAGGDPFVLGRVHLLAGTRVQALALRLEGASLPAPRWWAVALDLALLEDRLSQVPHALPTTLSVAAPDGRPIVVYTAKPSARRSELESYRGSNGEPVLGQGRSLALVGPDSGWIAVESPISELLLPVHRSLEAASRLFLLILILCLMGASYLARILGRSREELEQRQQEIERANEQLRVRNGELQELNERLEKLSITDGLTQLNNHRYFQEQLTREIERAQRSGETLALVLMDIDNFKQLNDQLGHSVGDRVLERVAKMMRETTRPGDLLARYGGEEFALVPRQAALEGAIKIAEKIRMAIASLDFDIPAGDLPHAGGAEERLRVTVSVGVACYQGDRTAFFEAADRALYQAKANGKDCVCVAAADA